MLSTLRRKALRLFPAAAAALLLACGDWKTDPASLTARTAAPAKGPDCASCHGYPLMDRNHQYHLFEAGGNRELNGAITCFDCHSQAIQFRDVVLFDTVYEEPSGERWRTQSHPNPGDTTSSGLVIRSLLLVRVESLPQQHPLPMPARPGSVPAFQEYITTLAHMNGRVDVHFAGRNSRPFLFEGQSASFNPTQETCSAVACHPNPGAYSFGSKAKGLPALNVDEVAEP